MFIFYINLEQKSFEAVKKNQFFLLTEGIIIFIIIII